MTDSAGTTFRVRAEHRWPVLVGLAVAITLYLTLPGTFTPPLRWAVVAICVACAIPLVISNPHHLHRESRVTRALSLALTLTLLVANNVAVVQLVVQLVAATRKDGPELLLASVQVWVTNVIGYAMAYWEMDRGGPIARRRDPRAELPAADFRFPQDENDDNVEEVARSSSIRSDWMPAFFDYLYFSASNSMAVSPTDVMPLSHRAKALMLAESFTGYVILALVIARSVSLLG